MSLFKKFVDKFTNKSETAAPIKEIEIKESDWDELTTDLIQSDLGRELTN